MNSSAGLWQRGFLPMVWAAAAAALLGAPAAEAQMIGDAFRSPLTSSLLQTSQQRDRRRLHRSSDPYIALIEQSSPDAYLRRVTASSDPYSATSTAALAALAPAPRAGMRAGVAGDPLGIGPVAGAAGVPGTVISAVSGLKTGGMTAAALGQAMSVVPGAGMPGVATGMAGMAAGVSAAGCSTSLAAMSVVGAAGCR
ncbi:hypothetical protein [Paraburkholderia kururiensis]|uniref:hypothetical protein n=1 Tax=Paraburkholderia kururiensis TaxID=984307 RepID=UPI0003669C5A|nr:hypothetical protein [Paraburkholderia kururiensis]